MVLENYISQISFVVAAIASVFVAAIIFKGAKSGRGGWTKVFGSRLFASKEKGFLFFLASIVVSSIFAIIIQPYIENYLRGVNILFFLIGFLIITWVYFDQTYYR